MPLSIFASLKSLFTLVSLLLLQILSAQAQEKEGIVFDSYTKQRIARVYIYNTANDEMTYNNKRGEFNINANQGDTLIALVKGYHPDTLVIKKEPVIIFRLNRATIWLNEVSVVAKRSPAEILEERKEEYNTAYSRGSPAASYLAVQQGPE